MKQLLVLLLLLCSMSVSAQDVIVKKDGSTVVCRVVDVTATEITYKKWSDLNGSNYVMDKSLASAINYESGKKDTFSQTESLYKPNNQNDGEQAMNDKALLRLDAALNNPYKKVKTLKTVGWISGIAGVCLGALFVNIGLNAGDEETKAGYCIIGGVLAAGGIGTSICCFVSAHKKQKQADMYLQSSLLYHYNYKFDNGSSLSAGIDMLSDRTVGTNTVGLGLRYNF